MSPPVKAKQGMSSVDVAVVVRELRSLEGCSVRSLLMPTKDVIVMELACGDDVRYLLMEGGRRIHLTKRVLTTESVRVVKLFRRFLEGAKLVGVGQIDLERVVFLVFRRGARQYILHVELLPRGLIALVNEEGKIVAVNKKFEARDRVVSVGRSYTPPPSLPNIMSVDPVKLSELSREPGRTVGQFFVRDLGLPPELVNEVLSEEERSARVSDLSSEVLAGLISRVRRALEEIIENPRPCALTLSGNMIGFFPYRPLKLPDGAELVAYDSMNALLDDYFSQLDQLLVKEREMAELKSAEVAVEKTLKEAEESLEGLSRRYNDVARTLELFERYYYDIESLWECSRKVVKERGWDYLKECGPVSGEPKDGSVTFELPEGALKLLLYEGVDQQYARLRREFEHLREKISKAAETVKDLRRKLEELVVRRRSLEELKVRSRRVTWFSKFLWIETSGGFLAIGGRDASQNEVIVRKYLGARDIFMHADVHGAAVFAVLAKGREVPEKDLNEVAHLAASYSKAWKAGLSSVDVFWVYGDQVKLSAPAGEYLPKGSFMVYGQKNYIRGVRLVLGIGVMYVGDQYDIFIGPPDLVKSRASAYVVVVPGDLDVEKAAEEIREHLVRRCPDVRGLTTRDVVKLLPGKVKVVEKA